VLRGGGSGYLVALFVGTMGAKVAGGVQVFSRHSFFI